LGAPCLGRAVPPVVGPLLVRLLGSVQPAVRREHQRVAPEQPAAFVVSQLECAERCHRRVGLGVLRAPTRAAESRARFARAGGDRASVVERAADTRRVEPRCIPASRERAASGIVVPADLCAADAATRQRQQHDARNDDPAAAVLGAVERERVADDAHADAGDAACADDAARRQPARAFVCAAEVADTTSGVRATAFTRRAAATGAADAAAGADGATAAAGGGSAADAATGARAGAAAGADAAGEPAASSTAGRAATCAASGTAGAARTRFG